MAWVVGTGMLLGLLVIGCGIATLRTGWIVPTARRHVTRPALHGIGALVTGGSVVLQGLFFSILPGLTWDARFYGGNALLLAGLTLLTLGQVLSPRADRDHTRPADARPASCA
ncbi:hypothetical protein AAHZ94_31645 [Streptomyces sp. HSW2009]|uniref:hypothetical protein n=1 Tax=Streptomyces sp. HSW2009 TaxID=3142890 RepID=UPI0032ECF33D